MISPKYHQIGKQIQKGDLTSDGFNEHKRGSDSANKFSLPDPRFKEQIGQLQQEIKGCMKMLHIESKRNKLLDELISVLKGEMFKYQKTKKIEEQQQQTKQNKLINKYQYEIDQISQKHNEEIAKIHNLKDLANSRRSERVVYSSLFKKLQKEIKHYEEIYRQQIILSQIASNSLEKNANTEQRKNGNQVYTDSNKQLPTKHTIAIKNQCQNIFLTAQKQQKISSSKNSGKDKQKKFHQFNEREESMDNKESFYREQKLLYTKQLLKNINQYSNSIQKIKIISQCSTTEQTIAKYTNIEDENKMLMSQISKCDNQIETISKQQSGVETKMRQEDFAIQMFDSDDEDFYNKSNEILSYQLENFSANRCKEENGHILQIIGQIIAELTGSQMGTENQQYSEESFRQIDEKLEILCKNERKRNRKNIRQDTMHSQPFVDLILQKMEKFSNCERIYDREFLRQQYYKQLKRKKQNRSRKEVSR